MASSDDLLKSALSSSFLSAFPATIVEQIQSGGIRLDIPAGGSIYHEDDEPRWGVVARGLIRVYMSAPHGRQVTVRYARTGDVLGIAAVVGGPAPVSVQILTPATIFFFSTHLLKEIALGNAHVGWLLAEELTHRLYETLEALAEEAFGTLKQVVARHLLDLAAGQQRGSELVAPISQQELADAVGSVRPAVARIVGELRAAGLVETTAGGITILDPTGLFGETWQRSM